jgi:hypothetical protein
MPGWFANGRADKERMGRGKHGGSGFTPRQGVFRKVSGALVNAATGKIKSLAPFRGMGKVMGAIKKGQCANPMCMKPLRGADRDVCSRKCAIQLEAQGFDVIKQQVDRANHNASTQTEWEKIVGGIQYDNNGKRIW